MSELKKMIVELSQANGTPGAEWDISDKIKEDSLSCIKELKNRNITTIMLTGDKKEIGEKVANNLKIDKVYTELLPDGKVEKMEELIKQKSSNSEGTSLCSKNSK